MSVLIKGMEMPENCKECRISFDIGQEWLCQLCTDSNPIAEGAEFWRECGDGSDEHRPDWCPLIPVPPHGRLGDLDELESGLRLCASYQDGYRQQGILGCCETIRMAATIIPADPAEEGEG